MPYDCKYIRIRKLIGVYRDIICACWCLLASSHEIDWWSSCHCHLLVHCSVQSVCASRISINPLINWAITALLQRRNRWSPASMQIFSDEGKQRFGRRYRLWWLQIAVSCNIRVVRSLPSSLNRVSGRIDKVVWVSIKLQVSDASSCSWLIAYLGEV